MRRSIIACGLLLALAGIPSVTTTASGATKRQPEPAPSGSGTRSEAQAIAYWDGKTRRAQATTARWLGVIRGRATHFSQARTSSSSQAARARAERWHERAVAARKQAFNPPHRKAWYCIHSYEGPWTDPNSPYWGGLQMDYNFQSAYGHWLLKHKGTADHWTPLEQIWAGVRAWRQRGFEPWSTTAHKCGVY